MFEWVLHTPLVLICLYKMEGERRESEAVEDFDITAWKVSKYGVIPSPYFRISGVNLRIQSEYRKLRTRNNFVFGHFPRSAFHNRFKF